MIIIEKLKKLIRPRYKWPGIDTVGDPEKFKICWEEGHIPVNGADDWFCPRCWTCFFMGYYIPLDDENEFKKTFLKGERVICKKIDNEYLTYLWTEFVDDRYRVFTLNEALKLDIRTVPPSKGGPPYVYRLERIK